MPSRFEPCGLNQMYSQRYGSVPIVHRTGGLADSVEPWDHETQRGTGFVFEHFDGEGLRWAFESALETYAHPEAWAVLRRNGMERDFSWDRQAERYAEVYRGLASSRRLRPSALHLFDPFGRDLEEAAQVDAAVAERILRIAVRVARD